MDRLLQDLAIVLMRRIPDANSVRALIVLMRRIPDANSVLELDELKQQVQDAGFPEHITKALRALVQVQRDRLVHDEKN